MLEKDVSDGDGVKPLSWAAGRLRVSETTCYRLAQRDELPGAFKLGGQWRISVPRFNREVHGDSVATSGTNVLAAGRE